MDKETTLTNKEFAESNTDFIFACRAVGLPFAKPVHKKKSSSHNITKNTLTRQASNKLWRDKMEA